MKMNYIILSCLIILYSCNNTSEIESDNFGIEYISQIDKQGLINKAIEEGDAKAYNEVASYHILNELGEDFLYVALIMANKYDNFEACYHVFLILNSHRNNDDVNLLDGTTRNIALYYLMKSYEGGYESAKFQVEEIFSDSIPKSDDYILVR